MTVLSEIPIQMIHGEARYLAYGHKMTKQFGNETYDWGIAPPPAKGSAAEEAGTGNVSAGDYLIHIIPESMLGRYGNPWETSEDPDPIAVTVTADNASINVTLPIHGDPQVKYMNVFRTRADDVGPFFFAGRVDNGTTSITLNGSDDSLPSNDVLEGPSTYSHDPTTYAGPFRYGRPPAKHICAIALDDRALVAGEKEYTEGSVSFTSGSKIVTGTNTHFNPDMIEKTIRVADEGLRYEIEAVDSETRLKLRTEYKLPTWKDTDPTDVDYILIGDPNALYVSEPGEPEYFNPIPYHIGKEGGGYIKGITAYGRDALVLTEGQVYLVQTGYGVSELQVIETSSTYGTISPRSVTTARGSAFFFSGDYICRYYNQDAQPISEPLGDLLENAVEDMKQYAISVIYEDYLLMAVSLSDTEYLDTILCYNLDTGIWDIWDGFRIVDMQTIITEDGRQYVYFVSPASSGYTLNSFAEWFTSDGIGYDALSGSITSADEYTVTVDQTLPTGGAGLAGLKIRIESGTGAGQERWIYTNTDSIITVEQAWTVRPDTTSEFSVAAIKTWIRSGRISSDHQVQHQFKNIELRLNEEES